MAPTKIDLVTQVKNILRAINGGTGVDNFPNPIEQVGFLYSDGVSMSWRTDVNEQTLQQLLVELQAIRLALTVLACDGGRARPQDFEPGQQRSTQTNSGGVQ